MYRRAATLAPSEAVVLVELARLLARDAKTRAEAEKLHANAATLAPQDAGLAAARAANLVALGDTLNATLEYRRAFEMKPDDETVARGFVSQVVRLGAAPAQITNLSQKLAATPDDLASGSPSRGAYRADARYNDALKHYWLAAVPPPTTRSRCAAPPKRARARLLRPREEFIARAAAGQPNAWRSPTGARVFSAAGSPKPPSAFSQAFGANRKSSAALLAWPTRITRSAG